MELTANVSFIGVWSHAGCMVNVKIWFIDSVAIVMGKKKSVTQEKSEKSFR